MLAADDIAAWVLEHLAPCFPDRRQRPGTNWWEARCPFHDDRKASFAYDGKTGGFNCQGCGAKGNLKTLCERLGIASPFPARGSASSESSGRLAATYDYQDQHGTLAYQVLRYDPKRFSQRRPDGNGGWIWNLTGTKRFPYRLPELLHADPEAPVFLVEGEKDVEQLRTLGLVATCNPGGAGKWPNEFSAYLRGRLCICLPDNDPPGEDHMHAVARSLAGVAAEIRFLILAELPPKGDVTDWIAVGGTAAELLALARAAPLWSPSEDETASAARDGLRTYGHGDTREMNPFRLYSVTDLVAEEEPEHLVHGLITRGTSVLLHAESGVGKTFLALDLACSIATGLPWLERATRQGPVVYIAAEGQVGLKIRLEAWMQVHGIPDMPNLFLVKTPVDPLDRKGIASLVETIKERAGGAVLVVFDTWSASLAAGGGDEDKAKDTAAAMANLQLLQQAFAATILIVHHQGRDKGRARGSTALRASCDSEFVLSRSEGDLVLTNPKQRDLPNGERIEFSLAPVELSGGRSSCCIKMAAPREGPQRDDVPDHVAAALEALRKVQGSEGASYTRWQESFVALTKKAAKTFEKIPKKLMERGLVVHDPGSRRYRTTPQAAGNPHDPPRGFGEGEEGCDSAPPTTLSTPSSPLGEGVEGDGREGTPGGDSSSVSSSDEVGAHPARGGGDDGETPARTHPSRAAGADHQPWREAIAAWPSDRRAAWEERAAVLQFEAELTQEDAELEAYWEFTHAPCAEANNGATSHT